MKSLNNEHHRTKKYNKWCNNENKFSPKWKHFYEPFVQSRRALHNMTFAINGPRRRHNVAKNLHQHDELANLKFPSFEALFVAFRNCCCLAFNGCLWIKQIFYKSYWLSQYLVRAKTNFPPFWCEVVGIRFTFRLKSLIFSLKVVGNIISSFNSFESISTNIKLSKHIFSIQFPRITSALIHSKLFFLFCSENSREWNNLLISK